MRVSFIVGVCERTHVMLLFNPSQSSAYRRRACMLNQDAEKKKKKLHKPQTNTYLCQTIKI